MRALSFLLLLSSAVVACSYPALPQLSTGDGGSTDAPDGGGGGCTGSADQCGGSDALYQCDNGSLSKVQDCQYGCSVDHCNACQANTTFCTGDDLAMCDSGGNIVNPMTCANGCQASQCNVCVPGTSSCNLSGNAVPCGQDGMPGTPITCGANGCINGVCNSCTPSTVTCNGDTLVTCGSNGIVQATSTCTFGCSSSGTSHCKVFTPLYGVGVPTGTQTDVVINDNATLDISSCTNNSTATLTIGATSTTLMSPQVSSVAQAGGSPICVVRFNKLTVNAGYTLNVVGGSGDNNVSLQATSDVTINGQIVSQNGSAGPAQGGSTTLYMGTNYNDAPGAGGGGGARAGGTGGACSGCSTNPPGASGGPAITDIKTVLRPGSQGGYVKTSVNTFGAGGFGGGAIHLLSMTKVTVSSTGRIVVIGGGSMAGATIVRELGGGGGSGGAIVIEAPIVNFSTSALAVANGGGGAGGCSVCSGLSCTNFDGQNGQLSATRAAGGNCNGTGNGGWEANGDTVPSANGANGNGSVDISGGGGGGADGFIFLRGKTGSNVTVTGAVISPAPTIEGVTAN